ncbi:unnamed protein product, partial [Prorocentrum cordatum]
MLIVSISLMNLVTALMVDNAMSQSVQDKEAEQAWEAASKKKAIPKLKEMFLDLDEDGSGCLELEELQNAPEDLKDQLRQIAKMEDCEELFHSLDYDGSGSIDVEEFCDGVLKASQENKPLELLRLARQCTAIHQSTKEALQLIQESWPEGSQGDKADFPAAPRPDAAAAVLDEGGRPRAAEASLGARVTSMELRIAGMESTLQNIADVLAAAAAAVRRPDRPAARAERRPDAPAPRGSAAAQLERAARAAAEAETAAKVAAEKQRRECIFASLRQQVLCCSQFSIGCPNGSRGEGPPFDCDLHAADPTRLWSPAKKEWCCLHVGRACAGDAAVAAPAEASCDLAGGASPSEWPAGRREHCCRTAGVGCARGAAAAATELDFDCEAGHSKWATGWSAEKKAELRGRRVLQPRRAGTRRCGGLLGAQGHPLQERHAGRRARGRPGPRRDRRLRPRRVGRGGERQEGVARHGHFLVRHQGGPRPGSVRGWDEPLGRRAQLLPQPRARAALRAGPAGRGLREGPEQLVPQRQHPGGSKTTVFAAIRPFGRRRGQTALARAGAEG